MKKTSYSQLSSKVLAVCMAALLSSFSLTPLAVADEASASEAVGSSDVTSVGDATDGKIHVTVALPSKSFVYDGEEHSIFDEEVGGDALTEEKNTQSAQGQEKPATEAESDDSSVSQDNETALDDEAQDAAAAENEAAEGASQESGKDAGESDATATESNIEADGENASPEVVVDIDGTANETPKYPLLRMISPEEFSFTYEGENYTVTGLTAQEVTSIEIGTVEYEATGTPQIANSEGVIVTEDFVLDIMPGTLTIEQRSLVLVSDSLIKTYEPGVALVDESGKISVEGDGFLPGDGAQYSFTGSQEEVGASLNTFTYEFDEGTDEGNYKVTEKPGTLRVTSFDFDGVIPITVEAVDETLPYDGQTHYLVDYATTTFDLEDETDVYTVEADDTDAAVATNVGEYSYEPSAPFTVIDSYGNDVSAWFDIDWQPITLTIEPRTMYLKVHDQTKLYGEEDPFFTYQFLASDDENEYSDQLAAEDDLGEITLSREEGEAIGEYAIIANYEENENYDVTAEEGTLSISAAKIEAQVESVHTVYDGEAHSVTVTCDQDDVMVLYKTPESEWGEENPAYTEIGTYPVYVQILPAEGNEGNTASDVVDAEVVIASDDPAAAEDPDNTEDDVINEDASNAEAQEPQGPASPDEDPDFAEPSTLPSNPVETPDTTLPDDLPTVDVNVNDLTIPDTAETDIPGSDLSVPENELTDDETLDSELLATTSSDNAVGANGANNAQSSETVPMTVNESSSNPFGGMFGIIAVGIIVLAICGIGAAIYLWRTKESEE